MGFRFSLVIPISAIIGLPTNTEDDPVIAKTIKMRIISHRYVTIHLLSSFLKQKRKNFRSKIKMTIAANIVKPKWKSEKSNVANLYEE